MVKDLSLSSQMLPSASTLAAIPPTRLFSLLRRAQANQWFRSNPVRAMFFQHPFTLGHHYSLAASYAIPTWKRAVDLGCCIVALPVLAVLTLLFSLIAGASARGPVFYRQQSVGSLGRTFVAFRFRTMRVISAFDAAADSGETSSRRTSISGFILGGSFLRATGLVDLPQIINVLRGEM